MKMRAKSLSSVLTAFFAICLALILTIVVTVVLVLSSQSFEGNYQNESKIALQGFSNSLKTYSNKTAEAANKLAGNRSLVEAINLQSYVTVNSLLKETCTNYGLSYLFITDASGKVMSSSTNNLEVTDFSKLEHFQKAVKGETTVVCEPIDGKNLCYCSGYPIKYNGNVIGIVSAAFSLQDSTLPDLLKSYTGCEFTVFYGDERISTTIQQGGKRQNGTKMDAGIAASVLTGKKNYLGKANILGKQYMAQYQPILGPSGNAVGAIFAGTDIDMAEQLLRKSIFVSIGISVLLMLAAAVVLRRFMKKRVKLPLSEVVNLANNMKNGEIGVANPEAVALNIRYDDEVGQVAKALQGTVVSLQQYIGEIRQVLSAVSAGNLAVKTQREYHGDFVEIKDALNHILQSLNGVFSDMNRAAVSVTTRSEQLSGGAIALSQGATQQASATQELSATVNEISAQVHKTAENAEVASTVAQGSTQEVEKGNRNVDEMLRAMNNINTASNQIGNIIKTIEDIAFQTNILALNAAVEAARAGSAGKGFAVVADEVRNLASKSAEAAKKTTELIENTTTLINSGVKVANSTAQSFQQIRGSTQKSNSLITKISEATSKEAASIAQVTQGIEQIAQVVQTNSATSEENAAASADLSEQAKILSGLVERFQLADSNSGAEATEPLGTAKDKSQSEDSGTGEKYEDAMPQLSPV